mgnify:FL=1
MDYITIIQGDDTNFLGDQFLVINFNTDIDLSGFTATFSLGDVTLTYGDLSGKNFEVILSDEITSNLKLGKQYGELKLIDREQRIRTVTSVIPFLVRKDVNEEIKFVNNSLEVSMNINDTVLDVVIETPGIARAEATRMMSYCNDAKVSAQSYANEAHNTHIQLNQDVADFYDRMSNFDDIVANAYKTCEDNITSINETRDNTINDVETLGNEKIELATEQANIATRKTQEVSNTYTIAMSDIATARSNSLDDIDDKKDDSISDIEGKRVSSIEDVNTTTLEGEESLKEIANENLYRWNLFDVIKKDYRLDFTQSRGLALLGTYVYKSAILGERYGYSDFYNKCIAEMQNGLTSYNEALKIVLPTFNSNKNGNITVSDARNNTDAYSLINGTNASKGVGNFTTYWFNIDYSEPTIISSYLIQADNNGSPEYPTAWTLQGTNNGEDWDILDEQSGMTFSLNQTRTFPISTNNTYQQYRIVFSAGNSNGELRRVGFDASKVSYVNANGHIYYDISAKSLVDNYFESNNRAWLYGIDTENKRVYLPQQKTDNSEEFLYMVVGNTVHTSEITNVFDITNVENDSIPLGYAHYDDLNFNHIGWLKSVGQINSGLIYTTIYNALIRALNFDNPYNFNVIEKKDIEPLKDYSLFWIVDIDNQTFICPTRTNKRVLISKKEATNEDTYWYNLYSDGYLEQGDKITSSANVSVKLKIPYKNINYSAVAGGGNSTGAWPYCNIVSNNNINVGVRGTSGFSNPCYWETKGYAEIPKIIDYENNISLYFKVANSVENLELFDAGAIYNSLSHIVPNNKINIIEYSMPDWSSVTSLPLGTNNIITNKGWIIMRNTVYNSSLSGYINGYLVFRQYGSYSHWEEYNSLAIMVDVNDVVNLSGGGELLFIPCKGVTNA